MNDENNGVTNYCARCEEAQRKIAELEEKLTYHRETIAGVRDLLTKGDIERAALWVSDSLSGYVEPPEATLLNMSDRANAAEAERDRLRETLKGLCGSIRKHWDGSLYPCEKGIWQIVNDAAALVGQGQEGEG